MKKKDLIEVNYCRVCNSNNIKKDVFKKNFYLSNFNLRLEIDYAICIECQYIFQYHYVGDDFLNNYYKNSPMYRNPEATIYDHESIKRQLEFIDRNIDLKKISSCLEIGAHTGHFLNDLKKHSNCKIYYDELSAEALNILKSFQDFHDFRVNNVKVDLVVLRHVLEHIHDLNSFLEYVNNSLNEKGIIFIEVPDWSILDNSTDSFLFEHLSQFNDKCLIDLFRRKNFRCLAIERSINKDDPSTPNRVMRLIFKRIHAPEYGNKDFVNYFNSYRTNKHEFGNISINNIYSKIEKNKTVAFFPASNLSFSAVLETEIEKINLIGYFDSDKKKQGKTFLGYKVFSTSELKKINPEVVFIFTEAFEPEIRDLFKKLEFFPKIYSYSKILNRTK